MFLSFFYKKDINFRKTDNTKFPCYQKSDNRGKTSNKLYFYFVRPKPVSIRKITSL